MKYGSAPSLRKKGAGHALRPCHRGRGRKYALEISTTIGGGAGLPANYADIRSPKVDEVIRVQTQANSPRSVTQINTTRLRQVKVASNFGRHGAGGATFLLSL